MNTFIKKALDDFHAVADADKDGKITKQDAAIILADLQAKAGAVVQKRTPLGAFLIVFLAGLSVGVLVAKVI